MMLVFHRIGARLILITTVFLVVLGSMTSGLIIRGFNDTRREATKRSDSLLLEQASQARMLQAISDAAIGDGYLQRVVSAAGYAAIAMASVPVSDGGSSGVLPQVALQRDGLLGGAVLLDSLFSKVLAQNPIVVAAYFVGVDGVSIFYPALDVGVVMPAMDGPWFVQVSPPNDPSRQGVWGAPYLDPQGRGVMVTLATPVYRGEEFRGVIGLDVSLGRLVDQIESIRSVGSVGSAEYVVVLDSQSRLVVAPEVALGDLVPVDFPAPRTISATLGLTLTSNVVLRGSLEAMARGESRVDRFVLGGEEVLFSYAPLGSIGWCVGFVVPIARVVVSSEEVASGIQKGTESTLRTALLMLFVFFGLAMVSSVVVSRVLTRPIALLVEGTRAVAAGDLTTTIPVQARGELGELAHSFNVMTSELVAMHQRLEGHKDALERVVRERTEELQKKAVALQESLSQQQQLNEVIAALAMPVLPVRDDVLVIPLFGLIDQEQADSLLRNTLTAISRRHARAVVLDVTGLAVIDTTMAQMLLRTAQAARLLGTEIVLVGIRPEFAQTLVSLGIDLGQLRTAATLQEGMALLT